MLSAEYVVIIHDEIIDEFGGFPGLSGGGLGGVEGALARVENQAFYSGEDSVFEIAGMYAEAIACGHVFNDGNKRTALTCALTYLRRQGIEIPEIDAFEEIMVDLAERRIDRHVMAATFSALWQVSNL